MEILEQIKTVSRLHGEGRTFTEWHPKVLAMLTEEMLTDKEMLSPTRNENIVIIRHLAMYFYHLQKFGCSEIGRMFKRDHSTVIYAVNRIEDILTVPSDKYYSLVKQYVNQWV